MVILNNFDGKINGELKISDADLRSRNKNKDANMMQKELPKRIE